MNLCLQFLLCAAVILISGWQLSKYGDALAEKTGMGKSWVGLVLLATITSLPELVTGVSAVTLHDLPDMAVSGTIGSCMFNMMIIALIDLMSVRKPVSLVIHQGHILSAGFGIVLMGFAAIDILFSKYMPVLTYLNRIDPLSIVYPILYLFAMRLIYSYEQNRLKTFAGEVAAKTESTGSLTRILVFFSLSALLTVLAATFLPGIGEEIGKKTGWGQSFIGSSFIAISTSLPEFAVAFSAAKRGSFDMAVASLLGSNLFNIVILSIIDFCYLKDPILRVVSPANTVIALTAMITMAIVIIGLTYRSEKKFWFLAGDAIAIIFTYVLANVLLFIAH